MYDLVGVHVNQFQLALTLRSGVTLIELLRRWQPPLIVTVDRSERAGALAGLRSKVVVRTVDDDSGNPDFNQPFSVKARAREDADRDLRAVSHLPPLGWLQHKNEPAISKDPRTGTDAMKRMAEYDAERARALAPHGWKGTFLDLACGTPETAQMAGYADGFRAAVQLGGLLCLHGYHWPTMLQPDKEWYLFRHLLWDALVPAEIRSQVRYAYTERGLDAGTVEPGRRQGWIGHVDRSGHLRQLARDSDELRARDPRVVGAATFAVAPGDRDWWSYDTSELLESIAAVATPVYVPMGAPASPSKPDVINMTGRKLPRGKYWYEPDPAHGAATGKRVRYAPRTLGQVTRTVIHHTATELGENQTAAQHLEAIARGHVRMGWPAIAYHYVIAPDGTIYQVNSRRHSAYHVGRYNPTSYGVCLIGKLHKREPTPAQIRSMQALCDWLDRPVVGHKDLMQTVCPGTWWL